MLFNNFQHRKVPPDILKGKRVLDLGCGRNKFPGAIGLDFLPLPNVDIVADLNEKLPFDNEEFDAVYTNQVLEHIQNIIGLVYEVHRILKPGGIFLSHVPYFRSVWAYIDVTHVRCFTINSMNYFVKGTNEYKNYRFRDEGFSKIQVFLDNKQPSILRRRIFTTFALRKTNQFENSFLSSLYPFQEVSYLLTK